MKVDVYEREGSIRLALPGSGSIERDRALYPEAPATLTCARFSAICRWS